MAKNKRKKYLVTKESEAYACSLVTSPAVEELFVSFSEDKPIVEKFADEKKHMITGVVAIPNKPIYRRNDKTGEEFDIVFSAEAIEGMAKDFLKNYHQFDVTLQHKEDAEGVHLVEQWIKQDPYRDKSAVIGLSEDLPVGSWIQTYYVDSNDVWQRIESGELRGFSLECLLGLEEFESQINNNENNDISMTNEEMFSKIKEMFNQLIASVSMNKQEDDIEPISMEDMAEQTPTEPTVETPVEQPTVETPTEAVAEEPKPQEEPKPTEETVVEEPKPQEAPKDNHLEELINSLRDEIKSLKEMNDGLDAKVKELSKQPSAAPVNVNAKPSAADSYSSWREQMRKML